MRESVVVLEEIKTLVPASFVIGSYVESCSREKANAISDLESRISTSLRHFMCTSQYFSKLLHLCRYHNTTLISPTLSPSCPPPTRKPSWPSTRRSKPKSSPTSKTSPPSPTMSRNNSSITTRHAFPTPSPAGK